MQEQLLNEASNIPFSSVGYLTYKRTYSRLLNESDPNGPTEEFPQTIQRVLDACQIQLDCGFTEDELGRLRQYFLQLKGSVAGRFLWQLGTGTVSRLGLASLQNCAFTVVDDPIRPFTWAMDMLALGSGVGYNIQRKHVNKLPPVRNDFETPIRYDNAGADFIVPDSREGWVKLLARTLKSAFIANDGSAFRYSTQLIRGKGAPIKGFGGVASGPEDLVWGIGEIGKLLEKRRGKQLRPIDCLDIMNIIGAIIVAGNVRRSAQIAIGDHDDLEFLLAKRWDMGSIPSWRGMSNNSVVCSDVDDLHDFFWDGYLGKGEPYGLINLELSRITGRTGADFGLYPDPDVEGYNPCAEQSLASNETCCLAESYLNRFKSKAEFIDYLILIYRICKHSLRLPCHNKETEAIVHKNMRMGIGITGVLQASAEQLSWLDDAYRALRAYDNNYSNDKGWPRSIKLTTVKPSGTLSLLPGVTPGCHPAYAKFMIRRISIASEHKLVQVCRDAGYEVEYKRNFDGSNDYGTCIVSFPFMYEGDVTLAKDMTAIDQLRVVDFLQTNWSDNSVSCTVYYKKEELPEIKKYLKENYRKKHKSLSFLLHSGHGFDQAPFEEISEEKYNELVAKTKLITSIDSAQFEAFDECASGACPIR